MMISCTQRELIVIYILRSHAPLYLLQLLLETSRGITETLEDTADGTHITILTTYTILIVGVRLALILYRHRRHKQFVGIGSDGKTVILIHRHHQRCSQTHVCRQELTLFVTVERYL